MKAVLQRVRQARVTVDDRTVGEIGHGLLVLLCIEDGDDAVATAYFARKIAAMRIFADADGKMNRSLQDVAGSALVVSQFTLAANWRKGNRPGFLKAAAPDLAEELLIQFRCDLAAGGIPVASGEFGAEMAVFLVNEGPVTIIMDSAAGDR